MSDAESSCVPILFSIFQGSTNAKELSSKGVRIWDANGSWDFPDSLGFSARQERGPGPSLWFPVETFWHRRQRYGFRWGDIIASGFLGVLPQRSNFDVGGKSTSWELVSNWFVRSCAGPQQNVTKAKSYSWCLAFTGHYWMLGTFSTCVIDQWWQIWSVLSVLGFRIEGGSSRMRCRSYPWWTFSFATPKHLQTCVWCGVSVPFTLPFLLCGDRLRKLLM